LIIEAGRPTGSDFVIQSEASQLVTLLAGADQGRRILDTCASPGGKATALAATRPRQLIACDVRTGRMNLLRRTVHAAGADRIRLVQADLLRPLPFSIPFDCVVVDAPCSGLGTLRRDPDIRWRRAETDLRVFAEAELRMLGHAADAVGMGGRLVYATCSSEPEENEQVVDAFLRADRRFRSVDARLAHPQLPAAVVDDRGYLRTAPDRHGLEGFFGAVFEKTRRL
jgi:16S rRNA (cytosine967-C5)-methyltransferase